MSFSQRIHKLQIWLYILILTIFSILINGYFFESGVWGHLTYDMPLINIYKDNSLYPNDLMKAGAPYYYTILNPLNAFLSNYVNVQVLLFGLYFIGNYFTFLMIFYISNLLFNNHTTSLLSVLFFLTGKAALGGQATLFPDMNQRVIAFPLLLLSLYLFLKNRYYLSMIVNGLVVLFHGWYGIFLFSFYLLYFILNYKKIGAFNIAKYLSLFLLFSSPLIIWKLLTQLNNPVFRTPDLLLRILYAYSGWHMFPFHWPIGRWIAFSAYLIAFVLTLQYRPLNIEYHKKALAFFLGVFILALISTIFSEIYPVAIVLNLHAYRATVFLYIFILMYLSNYLVNTIKKNDLGLKIASAGMMASLFIGNFKGIYVFLVLLFAFKTKSIIKIPLIVGSVTGFALGILGTFYHQLPIIPYLKFGTLPSIVIMLSCLFALIVYSFKSLKRKHLYSVTNIFVLFILALSSVYAIGLTNIEYEYEGAVNGVYFGQAVGTMMQVEFIRKPYDPLSFVGLSKFFKAPFKMINKHVQFPLKIPFSEFEEVQVWAKENTKKGSVFITPPYLRGFRTFSQRSIIGDCIDLALANPICIHGYIAIKRIEALCNTRFTDYNVCIPENCKPKYNNLPEAKLLDISKKYQASYVVVEKPWRKNLPLVFENSKFRVYKINDFDVNDTSPLRGRYEQLAKLEGISGCA